MADDDEEHTEQTLSTLPTAHVYSLPPRPSAGGWQCQNWPKTSQIFTARVVITALGEKCTIKLMDPEKGTLFAMCPLDNDNPQLSVEPVIDSSRYFVLRVSDGKQHAYLGMGFLERPDAFEFNVTLQDHVKRLRNEKEAAKIAAAPAAPPQDFTLKGSVTVSLPGGATSSRPKPAPAAGGGGLGALLPPPPVGGAPSRGRRPVAGAAPAAAAPAAAIPVVQAVEVGAAFGSTPFGADFGAAFGSDPFASGGASDPFAASGASDPFAASGTPTAPPAAPPIGFGSADPFGSAPFAPLAGSGGEAAGGAVTDLAAAFGDSKPFGAAPASSGGEWTSFG